MKRLPKPPMRLPAGALMLVIAVSIIIGAILLSLIFLAANRRRLVQRDSIRQELRRNLYSGLAYAQAHPELPDFQPFTVDLFHEGTDSVRIECKPWGVFDVAIVCAIKGPLRDTIVAMLGSTFNSVNQAALYLTDENVPLAVNDDAQIRGAAWLPKGGDVRAASLPLVGERRTGEAVMGAVHDSQLQLPLRNKAAWARIKAYAQLQLTGLLPTTSQLTPALQSASVAFLGEPTVWYHNRPFSIQTSVQGQVLIVSSHRLVVKATSQLDNVLLLAPTIIIESGFQGRVQLIARDTVVVASNCRLSYPSAICTYGAGSTSLVSLGEGTRVEGVVMASAVEPGLTCAVRMGATTTVEGQLFSAGIVENCGIVHGTVMCRRLIYHGRGSLYENHLVNGVIDRQALSDHFLTTPLLNEGSNSGVISWLR